MDWPDLLAAVFLFATNAKGVSSIQLANTLGIQQKTAFLLMHKLRDAIERELETVVLSGEVEIDGATFGGHSRLENDRRNGFDQRIYHKNLTNRRTIVVARQRGGRTVPLVVRKEADAYARLIEIIEPGSTIIADQAHAWDKLLRLYDMLRVSHDNSFSTREANTNYAESFWSLLRRMHRGTHHKWGAEQIQAYACEMAWRQDFRSETVEERTFRLLQLAFSTPKSTKWAGYYQRLPSA